MAAVARSEAHKGLSYKALLHKLLTSDPRPPFSEIVATLKKEFPRRANKDHKNEAVKLLKKLFRGRLKLQTLIETIVPIPDQPIEIKGIGKFEPKVKKIKKVKEVEPETEEVAEEEVEPPKKEKSAKKIEKKKAKREVVSEEPEDEAEEITE